jgi:hypothetical protein
MSEARINRISNEKGDGGPSLSGITTFSGLNYFVPPKGTTAERPSDCPPGSIRFNTDSAHLEYWDGLQWLEFEATNDELGGGTGSNTGLGNRAVWGGGYSPGNVNTMDYVTISTLGDAQDFGDIPVASYSFSACSSATRGLFSGYAPAGVNIYYITFASRGDAIDSNADLTSGRAYTNAISNSTRGIIFGGGSLNTIEYVTIASLSNAQDFGDMTTSGGTVKGCASSVRGLMMGGPSSPGTNTIEYITISTTGNAQDYGDLSSTRSQGGCVSNATRGVYMGGITAPAPAVGTNVMEFVTIASLGNAQDFGDLSRLDSRDGGAACSSTRGVFGGGDPNATPYPKTNVIDYITIATTGNSSDFGDLTDARNHVNACSNGHGGL